jgi:hypothetical protein
MKQKLLVLACFICVQFSIACDVCGCFMGIVPYDNQSSIALMHRYRVFNGYRNYQHHSSYFPVGAYKTTHGGHSTDSIITRNYSSKDYESFKVYELRMKYFFHQRWEVNAFASIVNNKSKEDTVKINHTGFADPSFFIGYHILQPKADQKFKQRLVLGVGLKIPSGNYYVMDNNKKRLPFLMQPGTGSLDGFTYLNYMLGFKKLGISTTANMKYNGSNFYHERVGASFTNFSSFFYKFNTKNWSFIPSINSNYEHTNGLYVKEKLMDGTKMNELMLGLGLDVFYKNVGLNCGVQKTVKQHYHTNSLSSVGRLFVSLTYNFDQRKYLIRSKE